MKQWILRIVIGIILSLFLPVVHGSYCVPQAHASDETVSPSNPETKAANGPVAGVQTVRLKKRRIREQIDVYGVVIAAPGALQTVSIPFESRVYSVMVNEGQKVSKGDLLLKLQPSPDTILQLNQVKNAFELARQSYREVERRYKQKLATNEQLLQSKQAFDQARLRLESMKKRGIDGESRITADVGGLVKRIYVQEGSIVPAGNPIIDIVAQHRLEVLLGVEPESIERIHQGQEVVLTRVSVPASPEVAGKVRKVSYAVNPTTRLVDVFVTLTSPSHFLLGESIKGKIVVAAAEGWIVPRSAVLEEEGRHVLFTVKEGRAVKHTIKIGIENGQEYQVLGNDLQDGDDVVVSGNYELTDGMAVTTEAGR